MSAYLIALLAVLALAALGWALRLRRRLQKQLASTRTKEEPSPGPRPGPTVPAGEIIQIGGRRWREVVSNTIEHDFWVLQQTQEAGIELYTKKGEDPGEFAARLLREVIASGKAFLLVGAFLVPAELTDQDWSPAVAQQTGEFMRKLEGADDKQIIQGAIISLLLGFFEAGLRSSNNSPIVSSPFVERSAKPAPPANVSASPS